MHDFALYRSIRWHYFATFDTANFTVSHCFAQIRIRLQLCRTISNYPTSVNIIYFALFRNVINIPHSFNLLRSILRFISYQFALFHSALHYFAKFHTVSHCVALFHIVAYVFRTISRYFACLHYIFDYLLSLHAFPTLTMSMNVSAFPCIPQYVTVFRISS